MSQLGSTIHVSNLEHALALAIEVLRKEEAERFGPTGKSAMRAGFEDNLKYLRDGFEPRIVYTP